MTDTQPVFQDIKRIDNNTIHFTLSPTRVGYANSLVRSIKSHVRTVGFRADMTENGSTSDVKVFKNSTPMSNEMLADRIGLLLVHWPNVDGWEKERFLFKLHVKNETPEIRHVTASDFEVLEQREGEEERVKVPNVRFFHPDPVSHQTCLIATLKPQIEGQAPEEIHLEAYASVGIGRDHVRFSPTCVCAYGYTRDTEQKRIMEGWIRWLKEMKKVDPRDLEKDQELKKQLEREFRSMEIWRCYKMGEDGEPFSYDWKVETAGVLQPTECVYRGCLAMAELCEKFAKLDEGDLPDGVTILPADSRVQGFDLVLKEVDHTLGNAIQTWIDDNVIAVDGDVTFAGFKVPHPLRDESVLRLGTKDTNEMTARKAVADACRALTDMYRNWGIGWNRLVEEGGIATPRAAEGGEEEPKVMWEAYAAGKAARAASPGPARVVPAPPRAGGAGGAGGVAAARAKMSKK